MNLWMDSVRMENATFLTPTPPGLLPLMSVVRCGTDTHYIWPAMSGRWGESEIVKDALLLLLLLLFLCIL